MKSSEFLQPSRTTAKCAAASRVRPMRVNDIARLVGVRPHVVRYYVREGLLQPMRDAENGYRRFLPEDVTRLRCIRAARNVGLSIIEISHLLDKLRRGGDLYTEMHELVLRTYAEAADRHEELGRTLQRLRRLKALCEARDSACRDLDSLCRVLEQVGGTVPIALDNTPGLT